jgi:hypothetical protein
MAGYKARGGLPMPKEEGEDMKDIYQVLKQKQQELEAKRVEVWCLLKVVPLLIEPVDITAEPAKQPVKESGS